MDVLACAECCYCLSLSNARPKVAVPVCCTAVCFLATAIYAVNFIVEVAKVEVYLAAPCSVVGFDILSFTCEVNVCDSRTKLCRDIETVCFTVQYDVAFSTFEGLTLIGESKTEGSYSSRALAVGNASEVMNSTTECFYSPYESTSYALPIRITEPEPDASYIPVVLFGSIMFSMMALSIYCAYCSGDDPDGAIDCSSCSKVCVLCGCIAPEEEEVRRLRARQRLEREEFQMHSVGPNGVVRSSTVESFSGRRTNFATPDVQWLENSAFRSTALERATNSPGGSLASSQGVHPNPLLAASAPWAATRGRTLQRTLVTRASHSPSPGPSGNTDAGSGAARPGSPRAGAFGARSLSPRGPSPSARS